ncbi:MAG: alpha/beta hydrolase [Gammaproteobacteria bacterium]|nr:alpha/beta hydrolase [Gammaproteobacteria bacterium]
MNKIYLLTSKGSKIATYIYNNVESPKAVVHLIHGASEHFTRYENFIKYLNENGFIVVGCDNLGHGDSCHLKENKINFNGNEAFESIILVKNYIEENYSSLPIYIYGHAMGSIIARKLLIDCPKTYTKAILCATTTFCLGKSIEFSLLIGLIRLFKGQNNTSKILDNCHDNRFEKKMIKKGLLNEGESWLTHDPNIVYYYINSPTCGESFSIQSFQSVIKWVNYVSKCSKISKGDHTTPILFITGSEDPATDFGKENKRTVNLYKKCNYEFIESIAYENMRHEVLNENNKELVYSDCVSFFNR